MQSASFANPAAGLTVRPTKAVCSRARVNSIVTRAFELMELPFAMDALEPDMSKSTFEFHWGKHHRAYVDNLNKQLETNSALQGKSLEEVVVATWNNGNPTAEFNNAAQIWNHDFFWESMAPSAGGKPTGSLAAAIDKSFGSYDEFAKQFKAAGATQFGSGWAWLVAEKDGSLSITKTPNAVNPMCEGKIAILTMDVWEHAYYLDVQNRRPAYMDTFVEKLINWAKVQERYDAATS